MFIHQKTINNKVSCFGIGLHSGEKSTITLLPAQEDTGIVFKRTDIEEEKSYIPATYNNVSNTLLGTTLSNEHGITIATIEHLMAAFWGCGIDNCIVEIDGAEIPIMDGSSEPFVFLIECAGIKELQKYRKVIEVLKEVTVTEDEIASTTDELSSAKVVPSENFAVTLEIDFGNEFISNQKCIFDSRDVSFKNDLCRARTFGFAHEVSQLREKGLAKGGSLDNAIVVDDNGVMNKDGLRYKDEFVRHKVVDCIGDVFLAGAYLKGHFHGVKSGHALNNKLLRKFFSDKSAWRLVEPQEQLGSFN